MILVQNDRRPILVQKSELPLHPDEWVLLYVRHHQSNPETVQIIEKLFEALLHGEPRAGLRGLSKQLATSPPTLSRVIERMTDLCMFKKDGPVRVTVWPPCQDRTDV